MPGTQFVAVACIVCVASPGAAQVIGQSPSSSLTIEQAIDEALQHNLSLLAERSSLSIAETAMMTARLRPNPVASVSADHLDVLGTGFDATNNGGPTEIALRVDVPIERGSKREKRIALAEFGKAVAEAQFADAVRTLRVEVTLACIDVLAARANYALVADNLRAFEDLARVNRARATAGSIAPFEATRSDIAMLQFRSTVVRAQLDLATATARLRTLVGRSPGDRLEIVGDLSTASDEAPPDLRRWQQLALERRPDLRALELGRARSLADLRLQQAMGQIDYTLGAEYRRQQGLAARSNSVGFFVSAPLPISNRNQGEIARADAEREQVSRQIAARRLQVLADVQSAYTEFVTSRDLVASIERELLRPATSVRDISAYTYKAGGSTLLELLDAQRAFNETMQSYLDAETARRRAATRLNAAIGTEVAK